MTARWWLSLALLLAPCLAMAQAPASLASVSGVETERTWVPVDVGLAPGLDVNAGFSHPVNSLALGLVGTRADGIRGLGAGGLLQLATGELYGAQLATGLVSAGQVAGVQASVGAALSSDGVRGLQTAVGVTAARGSLLGLQAAAGVSAIQGRGAGAQLAGVMAVAHGPLDGLQTAGVFAVSDARVRGAQLSGLFNLANDVDGLQLAGGANVAERVRGLQLAVVNIAGHVDGAQLGLVNVAGEVHGATLGAVNVVARGGNHTFSLAMTDVTPIGLEGRLGARRVYSVLGIGLRPDDGAELPRAELGLGVRWIDVGTFSLDTEAVAIAASTRERWDLESAPVQRVQLLVRYAFDPELHAFFGPALNGLASTEGRRLADLSDTGSIDRAPSRGDAFQLGLGFSAGLEGF